VPALTSQIRHGVDDNTRRRILPGGRVYADLQQVDLRRPESWRMTLADVPTPEAGRKPAWLIHSRLFICAQKLKPLMLRHKTGEQHIVNVSAMEEIDRFTKTDKHPHTNMARHVNMMTLLRRPITPRRIFMNAVDTGWCNRRTYWLSRNAEKSMFQPPLDIVDGAGASLRSVFLRHRAAHGESPVGQVLKGLLTHYLVVPAANSRSTSRANSVSPEISAAVMTEAV
jgi:hypothetical protein